MKWQTRLYRKPRAWQIALTDSMNGVAHLHEKATASAGATTGAARIAASTARIGGFEAMPTLNENTHTVQAHSEHQARRAAKRVGLRARKSRWRAHTVDNLGGFQIIDPRQTWIRPNGIVAGEKFDLTADDVVKFCAEYANRESKRESAIKMSRTK